MFLSEIFTIYIVPAALATAPNCAGRCVHDPKVENRLPDNREAEGELDQVSVFPRQTQEPLPAKPEHGAFRLEAAGVNVAWKHKSFIASLVTTRTLSDIVSFFIQGGRQLVPSSPNRPGGDCALLSRHVHPRHG